MSYYAMIVVIECDHAKEVSNLHPDEIQFIGPLWEIDPLRTDDDGAGEFDTDSAIAQRESNR